ncbi:MAG: MATE family efflux transporter [Prevotella sp.]|nr:MATE family efflux transporter [Prevotella sp.]
MNIRDKQILQIALPSIVSNITVPLLGMIDVAIVGHMGSPVYIGAVAVGSMIFNLVYWLFGFLRMGTSGLTAQALGRRDLTEVTRLLVRSVMVALGIALLLIVLQMPLKWLMFWLIGPTADVMPFATTYFDIVIWGAPASLALFSLMGWFIGMQNTRIPMFISIMQNVVNILASLTLVYGFGMKIEGVALGTVIAQYAGLLIALGLLVRYYGRLSTYFSPTGNHHFSFLIPHFSFFKVNRDIFLRTLCLVAVNLFFTSAGARQGAVILSVNTVLLQLYLFFSYFMDGFAYAGEALCGKAYGAHNAIAFHETLRRLWMWMVMVTTAYTLLNMIGGQWIVALLTDESQVVETSCDYIFWAWLIPIAGCVAFIWDGVFIGMTATRGMLISSFLSALVFFTVYGLTVGVISNHGLWLAQVVYLAMRGIIQTVWYRLKLFNTI